MKPPKHSHASPKHIEYVFDEASGLYCRAKSTQQYVVVFASEAHASGLCAALPQPYVRVTSRAALIAETAKRTVAAAFVDVDLLYQIAGELANVPIVGIIDDLPSETLSKTLRSLDSFPWLSHVITSSMLATPMAPVHLHMLLDRFALGPAHDMLGAGGVGRVALLARASRREARFERMHEFFAKRGLSSRTIAAIGEVSEELVMNALYDAPVEAGFFDHAIPRTEDVDLPVDRACEISYGLEGDNVFVRLRDTFGALSRSRLIEVLNRCNKGAVALDESRGGAGLGLWRVFSTASTISITVIPGQLTDVLIGLSTKDGRLAKQLLAVHLFFVPIMDGAVTNLVSDDDRGLLDHSITFVGVS